MPLAEWMVDSVRYSSSSEGLRRQIAGGVRRIERQLREEALAIGILPRQQLELIEIADSRVEVFVQPLEMRAIPLARGIHLALPLPLRIREPRSADRQVLRQSIDIACGTLNVRSASNE